jgi:hypothetical protein
VVISVGEGNQEDAQISNGLTLKPEEVSSGHWNKI